MNRTFKILTAIVALAGIIISALLIFHGLGLELPEKHVYVSSNSNAYYYDWDRNVGAEYLGGDCYNYIVEASLKAGYYSAVTTEKYVCIVGGLLILFFSLFKLFGSLDLIANASFVKESVDSVKNSVDSVENAVDSVKNTPAPADNSSDTPPEI